MAVRSQPIRTSPRRRIPLKVLVVAPHPDDETLGCGGTLLKHKAAGDEIHWLIMTMIKTCHNYTKDQETIRQQQLEEVTKNYGFTSVHSLDLPPAGLDKIPLGEIISSASKVFDSIQPAIIYLPFAGDAHTDHEITFKACFPSTKIFRHPYVRSVRIYETLSETDFGPDFLNSGFAPNLFINIEEHLAKKLEILELYEGEIHPPPFPRSIEAVKALALLRGHITGTKAAESFMIARTIEK